MTIGAHPEPDVFGFLLRPRFTANAVASAVDVLSMANYVSGQKLYEWYSLSSDGESVEGTNRFRTAADYGIECAPYISTVAVCCAIGGQQQSTPKLCAWLRRQRAKGAKIGAISTGTWMLADAGLLDRRRCTIHWEDIAAFKELHPGLNVTSNIFEVDGPIFTCSGGTAAIDLFLSFVAERHGIELARDVSEQLVCSNIRPPELPQRADLPSRLGITENYISRAIEIMQENIETPIPQTALARLSGVSERHLERLFQGLFGRTPQLYYREVRLRHAQSLLRGTSLSVREIALASGFSTSSYFSKCYLDQFGQRPTAERLIIH